MAKGKGKSAQGDKGVPDRELTDKEHHFCVEYSVSENATKSYQRVYGCGYNTAKSAGCLLLQNTTIRQRIDEMKKARNKRLEISSDKVIKGIAALAFYDPRSFFDEDGRLKPIGEIDPDESGAISGLETLHKVTGDENDGMAIITKIKLADRKGALELLGKHLRLFADKALDDETPPPPTKVIIEVKDARKAIE